MQKTKRWFNSSLAVNLEDTLNKPYNHDEGPECPHCHQKDDSEYELTGYIIDDGYGVFVEKKCRKCGAITEDGHGDFHEVYKIADNYAFRIDDLEDAKQQEEKTQTYWYDLWDSSYGNFAYVQTSIEPDTMKRKEKEFMNRNPRKEHEEDEDYLNRFFEFLRKDKKVQLRIVERPSNSICLDLN